MRVRALAVGAGLIPPRTMHSQADVSVLLDVLRRPVGAPGALRPVRRVVEIGVYEGASAIALCGVAPAGAELHLVDPFGRHPDALPSGWGATEWATRRAVARALRARERRRGAGGREAGGPTVRWHTCLSAELARDWRGGEVDLVFIDGDHSEAGCELDWSLWHPFVPVGGHVVFHDARLGLPGGRGLPGPTAVVARRFRAGASSRAEGAPGWEIVAEADRTVAVRRNG